MALLKRHLMVLNLVPTNSVTIVDHVPAAYRMVLNASIPREKVLAQAQESRERVSSAG